MTTFLSDAAQCVGLLLVIFGGGWGCAKFLVWHSKRKHPERWYE